MIKRVNFTGRRRIPRERVRVEVTDGPPRTFSASFTPDKERFPVGAVVCLEVMAAGSNQVQRIEWGEVDRLEAIRDRALEVEGRNVYFRLKVIDRSGQYGRILGIADQVRPVGAQAEGILPIERRDLGEEAWRLDFGEQDVTLLINERPNGLFEEARSGCWFHALVYPMVLRMVLERILLVDRSTDADDPDDDGWPARWLRFGRSLHPERMAPPSDDETPEEKESWIAAVVDQFTRKHKPLGQLSAELAEADEP